jgi:hypothetical protein
VLCLYSIICHQSPLKLYIRKKRANSEEKKRKKDRSKQARRTRIPTRGKAASPVEDLTVSARRNEPEGRWERKYEDMPSTFSRVRLSTRGSPLRDFRTRRWRLLEKRVGYALPLEGPSACSSASSPPSTVRLHPRGQKSIRKRVSLRTG